MDMKDIETGGRPQGDSLFESYEASYCSVSTSVANTLGGLQQLPVDQRLSKARQLQRQLLDVEQTLQRMDMEARSHPGGASAELVKRVKEYRKDWQKLNGEVKKALQSAQNRSELGLGGQSGGFSPAYQTAAGQRDRLLSATEQLNQTSGKIQEGRRQLLETEVRLSCWEFWW